MTWIFKSYPSTKGPLEIIPYDVNLPSKHIKYVQSGHSSIFIILRKAELSARMAYSIWRGAPNEDAYRIDKQSWPTVGQL